MTAAQSMTRPHHQGNRRAWRVEVRTRDDLPDPQGLAAASSLRTFGLPVDGEVRVGRGFLLDAGLRADQVQQFADEVLADPVSERFTTHAPDGEVEAPPPRVLSVQPLPGVTDPVAASVQKALRDSDLPAGPAGTFTVYHLPATIDGDALLEAAQRCLANPVIQSLSIDQLPHHLPGPGSEPDLAVHEIELRDLDDNALVSLSRDGGLALNLIEMRTVQTHFRELEREPTRIELETIAQTWSEHCKHKTLTGKIRYGGQVIDNLLEARRSRPRHPRPSTATSASACSPTTPGDHLRRRGLRVHQGGDPQPPLGHRAVRRRRHRGRRRDPRRARHRPRRTADRQHRRILLRAARHARRRGAEGLPASAAGAARRGAGVRDYGNPMGIPTVNGAVHFDPDFVGNPLVYVGNVGILPRNKVHKQARAGDVILAVGGRTGRDGIHGATFSSLELHTESETVSSGAVQIGDPITERKVDGRGAADPRRGPGRARVTDCGAGGFSSAVGEMAEGLGADVELADVPLKYQGLAPWEIWISEAQERMVLAVPPSTSRRARADLRRGRRRGDRDRRVHRHRPPGDRALRRPSCTPTSTSSSCTTALPDWEREALAVARAEDPDLAPSTDRPRPGAARRPRRPQRRQQGVDHPPVRPRGAGRQRRQAARAARATTVPPTPPSSRPSSARAAAWSSACGLNPRYSPHRSRGDGRVRPRRGHAQRRRHRRRPGVHRRPRQLLLGQHRPSPTASAVWCAPRSP